MKKLTQGINQFKTCIAIAGCKSYTERLKLAAQLLIIAAGMVVFWERIFISLGI